jgi:predicted Zn-dependent protease
MLPRETTYDNMGYIYQEQNKLTLAKQYYYDALGSKLYLLTTHKHALVTYVRLGTILVYLDEPKSAKSVIKLGLMDYPNSGDLCYLLAMNEYEMHNQKDAVAAALNAKTYSPSYKQLLFYYNLKKTKPFKFKKSLSNHTYSLNLLIFYFIS